MNKEDISRYVLINLILLILAFLLTLYIVVQYNLNKKSIVSSVGDQTNVIISSVQAEKETTTSENGNTQTVVPVIVDTNAAVSKTDSNYYKYYYNQLDANAKKIYDTIEQNIDNMKSGTYSIQLSSSIANVLDSSNPNLLNEEFQSAWDAITMDRVDLFYIDVSKLNLDIKTVTYSNGDKKYTLSMVPNGNNYLLDGFSNEQIVNMAINQVESNREQIISNLTGNNYNKIMQVHNYLIDNISYGTSSGANAYNIYGALIPREVVCEGYAEAFKYIMDAISIPCVLVVGTATNSEGTSESHEWNYVQLDGNWYAIDVTWDDPILKNGATLTKSAKYKYFLKGSEMINKNHFANGKISTSGINFIYPTIENGNY